MTDPPVHPKLMPPQSSPNSSAASTTPPPPSHFPYPHIYLDPLTAAAAFYHHPQPNPSNPTSQQQPQPPYYIPDPANTTSTAATATLQQVQQLQIQLQLHQLQQHPHHILPQTSTAPSHQSPTHFLPPPPQSLLPPNPSLPFPQPFVPESQMMSAYRIGRYTPAERRIRLQRYREKRAQRNYNRRVKYDCRKMIADKRRRVQGRFVKREEEMALASQPPHLLHHLPSTEDGTEDGTEDDTKLHQAESSGSPSRSSSRPPDSSVALDPVALPSQRVSNPSVPESFCEQSDQVLQFR